MTIAFVRHGETSANRDGVLLGRADPPLTDVGRVQAQLLAASFAATPPAVVVSSPLHRSRETAGTIAKAYGLDVIVDDRLIELDYGEWDLARASDIPRSHLVSWRHDPAFEPPGGESLRAVGERVSAFCRERIVDDATVVAVSHVSPIKAGVTWALGADPLVSWRLRLDLASVSRIGGNAEAPVLLAFNETGHLT